MASKLFDQYIEMFVRYSDIIIIGFIILFILGIIKAAPAFFFTFYFVTKILLAMYLIYRFNSYLQGSNTLTDLDRKITFSSGIYIAIFTGFELYEYIMADKVHPTKKSSIEVMLEYLQGKVAPVTAPVTSAAAKVVNT